MHRISIGKSVATRDNGSNSQRETNEGRKERAKSM